MEKKNKIVIGGYYRHFKGNLYKVLGISSHTESLKRSVVYGMVKDLKSEPDLSSLWNRPINRFIEKLTTHPGRYRFELVSNGKK